MNNKKLYISISAACTLATNTLLAVEDYHLETLTVSSATKTEQSIQDVTSNVKVLTSLDLQARQVTTVAQALELISGVSFTSNGGLGSTTSIFLRGMGNNRTLVLLNGIKLQDPSSTSGANIAHLMINDIDRIEIIKGAQSGIWGADATAGVINIITKKPKSGTNGSVGIEYGSFNTKKINGNLTHKEKNFDLNLSAQKIDSDGFSVQAPKGEDIDKYEDDSYENTNLQLAGNYFFNDLSSIGFNYSKTDAQKEYDSFGNPDNDTMKSDIENDLYTVFYKQKLGKHNLKLKLEKSEFQREEIGTTFGVKEFEGESDNLELSDNFQYLENSFVILGIGVSKDNVTYIPVFGSVGDKENKDSYFYLTNSNKFDNTIITQSLRYDKYNNFDNKFTGKLGIKHNFSNEFFISSNYGTAYNVPNIIQELNPWGDINPNLNPENSYSADFNLRYKEFNLTYFYQKIDDLIEWYDPDGWGGNPAIYKNLDGKSTFKGLELEYKKELLKNTLVSFNYTRLSAKNKNGEHLKRRPEQTFKFGIDNYSINKLHFGFYGEYIGARYEKDNKQGVQTGKYTIANMVLNYDYSKVLRFYTKIDNLTDKSYQTVDGYATSPRAFYAGIKYTF